MLRILTRRKHTTFTGKATTQRRAATTPRTSCTLPVSATAKLSHVFEQWGLEILCVCVCRWEGGRDEGVGLISKHVCTLSWGAKHIACRNHRENACILASIEMPFLGYWPVLSWINSGELVAVTASCHHHSIRLSFSEPPVNRIELTPQCPVHSFGAAIHR